ncbi:MAG: hypothetical protein PHW13_00930 [Methylococcales bacterium]|nr:hypothetical protein [Methylococcales bacterium]
MNAVHLTASVRQQPIGRNSDNVLRRKLSTTFTVTTIPTTTNALTLTQH